MAILDLVYYGDPRLEKVSEPINDFNTELRKFVKDLFETMYFKDGVGLSSPQVGVNCRVLVIDTSGGTDRSKQVVLINPVIMREDGEQKGPEGCLSFPGLFADVKRPNILRVKSNDLEGNEFELQGSGLLARAIHHEIDHLNGILFIERMKKSDREAIIKKMKKMTLPPSSSKDRVLM